MPITNPISNPSPSPKDVVIIQRGNDNSSYGEIHISGSELIFYTDTAGYVNAGISSSFYTLFPPPVTPGGLTTGATYSITASWARTSSLASNVIFPYVTVTTSSAQWITASFINNNQYVSIGAGDATYNFTCSNIPSSGIVGNLSMFLYNTAPTSSSLSFPSDWIFIGVKPTSISSSKSAILNLNSYGNVIVAHWGVQY